MNREYIETFLGKLVEIKLFDGEVIRGYFHKTGSEEFLNNPNLYIPKKYYVLTDSNLYSSSCIFRSSHIRKIKTISAMNINHTFKIAKDNK